MHRLKQRLSISLIVGACLVAVLLSGPGVSRQSSPLADGVVVPAVSDAATSSDTASVIATVRVLSAAEAVDAIIAHIQGLSANAFKKFACIHRAMLCWKLRVVKRNIERERYGAAILILKRDIRPKMDGTLTPDWRLDDRNDWITQPEAQQHLCGMIDDLMAHLKTLQ